MDFKMTMVVTQMIMVTETWSPLVTENHFSFDHGHKHVISAGTVMTTGHSNNKTPVPITDLGHFKERV